MTHDRPIKLVRTDEAGRTSCKFYELAQGDEAVAAFNRAQAKGRYAMLAAFEPGQGYLPQFATAAP